jgi:hypothetical protein
MHGSSVAMWANVSWSTNGRAPLLSFTLLSSIERVNHCGALSVSRLNSSKASIKVRLSSSVQGRSTRESCKNLSSKRSAASNHCVFISTVQFANSGLSCSIWRVSILTSSFEYNVVNSSRFISVQMCLAENKKGFWNHVYTSLPVGNRVSRLSFDSNKPRFSFPSAHISVPSLLLWGNYQN